MSRVNPDPVIKVKLSDEVLSQLGIDLLDIPTMSEDEVYELLHSLSHHLTRRSVRMAILRKELVGVRKGRKYLFSKREALRWMQADSTAYGNGGDAA